MPCQTKPKESCYKANYYNIPFPVWGPRYTEYGIILQLPTHTRPSMSAHIPFTYAKTKKNKAGRLNERAQMVYHERRGIIEQQGKERQGRHCFAKHCNKTKPNHHRHKNILLMLFIFTFISPLFASFLPSLHIFFFWWISSALVQLQMNF